MPLLKMRMSIVTLFVSGTPKSLFDTAVTIKYFRVGLKYNTPLIDA
jgi:hypothetical protein